MAVVSIRKVRAKMCTPLGWNDDDGDGGEGILAEEEEEEGGEVVVPHPIEI